MQGARAAPHPVHLTLPLTLRVDELFAAQYNASSKELGDLGPYLYSMHDAVMVFAHALDHLLYHNGSQLPPTASQCQQAASCHITSHHIISQPPSVNRHHTHTHMRDQQCSPRALGPPPTAPPLQGPSPTNQALNTKRNPLLLHRASPRPIRPSGVP